MTLKERTTPHSPRCTECGEMVLCEFSDEELKQLVAGTLSFICVNGKATNPVAITVGRRPKVKRTVS